MKQAKPKTRLYVPHSFAPGQTLALTVDQSHFLANVMRCQAGSNISVFNGKQGEWLAEVAGVEQRVIIIKIILQFAGQKDSPDVWLAFAPVKNRLEMIVEKAVEMGVSNLMPVFTARCVVRVLNHVKLQSYMVSAAEQCGRHDFPKISEQRDIGALLAAWPKDRTLLFADETGEGENIKTLVMKQMLQLPAGKFGVLVGPEGGFTTEERTLLKAAPFVRSYHMGPRIMRADTAVVAALTCVQGWLGDWSEKPAPRTLVAETNASHRQNLS